MGKHIRLSIADPCHENWDNMTQAEQGRFCNSCQKQVTDFTSMTDAQLAAFFKKRSTASVCGRFYQDQLDRDMQIPTRRIPWVKYFFQFALPTFLMSAKAAAQGNGTVKKENITVNPPMSLKMGQISIPRKKIEVTAGIDINGKIVDENNNPVPYASVMGKGGKSGVSADSSGAFTIEKLLFGENIVLEVSSVGYQDKEVIINRQTDLTKGLVIQLNRAVLEEVVVTASCARIVMGAMISGITIKKTMPAVIKPPEEKPAMIKIYPNPVLSGTSINIVCEKLEEGYYSFQIFNQAGQQLQNKQVWIDAEARTMNMEIPSVAAGSYVLTLTNKESGKRFSEKIIIQ